MIARSLTSVKPTPKPLFAPVPTKLLQRQCACGGSSGLTGECIECQKKRLTLQRRPANQAEVSQVPPIVQEVLNSPGQPLDLNTRNFMEASFRHEFSQVRLHTDAKAAESAQAVNALAYTVGRDIVVDVGKYTPGTAAGKKLIAHELVHVLQQGEQPAASTSDLRVGKADDASEREADTVAQQIVTQNRSEPVATSISPIPGIQRHIQRQPNFSPECNEFHRCNVIEPLVHSKQMVDAVLAELPPVTAGTVTTGRIIDLLNVHFHTASATNAAIILDNFRRLRSELNGSTRFVCHNDNPPDCETTATGFVGGFTTCAPNSDVHLCSLYHVSLTCEEQARVLVHEAAHHIPGLCHDHAYVGDANYMTLPPNQAMENADTYAQFAKMVFLGSPSCVDCGFEIQRGGRRRRY